MVATCGGLSLEGRNAVKLGTDPPVQLQPFLIFFAPWRLCERLIQSRRQIASRGLSLCERYPEAPSPLNAFQLCAASFRRFGVRPDSGDQRHGAVERPVILQDLVVSPTHGSGQTHGIRRRDAAGASERRVAILRASSPSDSTGVSERNVFSRSEGWANRRRTGSQPMWP